MPNDAWYYLKKHQSLGPHTLAELRLLYDDGEVSDETLVWTEGSPNWAKISDAIKLSKIVRPPPLPGQTGIQEVQSFLSSDTAQSHLSLHTHALTSKKGNWSDIGPHPWRRFFARTLDTAVNGMTALLFLSIILYSTTPDAAEKFFSLFDGPSGRIFDGIITSFFATILSAVMIGLTGGSIGKWFFGIRVRNSDGQVIGLKIAYLRELYVWIKGLGCGVPIIYLFTAYSGYSALAQGKRTTWDEELNLHISYRVSGPKQTFLNLTGVAAIIAVIVAFRAL